MMVLMLFISSVLVGMFRCVGMKIDVMVMVCI